MGNFPEEWNYGLIKLIHKGNDIYDPNNYRGITLCLGKLFCTILYNRLATISEQENIYCKEQGGGGGGGSARNIEQQIIYSF